MARGDDRDTALLDLLTTPEPVGARVYVRSFGFGNRVTVSEGRMGELFPAEPLVLRERYEHVLVRRDGHLLEVTIDRPAVRNSLHPMANDSWTTCSAPSSPMTCGPPSSPASATRPSRLATTCCTPLRASRCGCRRTGFGGLTSRRHLPEPVIAAVNGYAMGGGFEIALACHLVVADATAQFALSEVKVGLVAGAGGLVRLPRAVPPKVAAEMILTGRRVTAAEAMAYGVVNRVTAPGAALDGARALAAEILDSLPTSARVSLRLMEETRGIADVTEAVNHPTGLRRPDEQRGRRRGAGRVRAEAAAALA